MTTTSEHHSGSKLQSTRWIIDARWYYIPLAFFLGWITKGDSIFISPAPVLIISLCVVLLSNIAFFFYVHKTDLYTRSPERIAALNISQIAIDLAFFFVVMLSTGGGIENIGHSFFFIPIIVSMILFGFQGTITVAIVSGFLVLISVILHSDIPAQLLQADSRIVLTPPLSLALAQSGIIFLIYLLTGFISGYISRLIKARDILLLEQIKKGEEHVRRLEELTDEFDKSAKLLVRRDLELSNANEKLTQLDRMKSEIISVVAHQLRTPLSAIKWTLKILLDEDAGKIVPEQRELISKGFESNERMISLVNDMLAVDRLESGKIKYNFVPVQFEDLVQDMIRNLLPLATQKEIRVECSIPEQQMPKIKIDPDKMRDVLQNLIDNAIKYTRNTGTIEVGVSKDAMELHFWVKDNGIGIPVDEQDKIFSRFFRAQNAVHTQTDGSGLGLFIAQSVVKRHGGKIWFESELGKGTTFHVLLPFTS